MRDLKEKKMEVFADFLSGIENKAHREITEEVLGWTAWKFPTLTPVIKWNQPMFTEHETFIIGFSVSKNHLAVSPERETMVHFEEDIKKAGHDYSKEIIRFPFDKPIDYDLLEKMIMFNIKEKEGHTDFWRK